VIAEHFRGKARRRGAEGGRFQERRPATGNPGSSAARNDRASKEAGLWLNSHDNPSIGTMKRKRFTAVFLLGAALAAVTTVSRAEVGDFQAETSDGRKMAGSVVALDSDGLTLRTADGPVSIPTEELMVLSPLESKPAPDEDPAVWVDLVDGSELLAAQWTLDGDTSRVVLRDGRAIEVPRRALESIRFRAAPDAIIEQWSKIVETKHDGDVVVLRKDDHLDFLRGVVRGATDESVDFEMDGDVLAAKRDRLFGVIFLQPAGRDLPEAMGRISDASGSEWSVQSVSLPGELEWTTPAGVKVSQSLAAIGHIDFSAGKVVYLADLEPQSVQWQPFFPMDEELASRREFFRPRRNRGLESESLELGGVRYTRGLAMHSRSEIVYRMPDGMTRLTATAGIDDRVRPHGNVLLIIRGDEKTLFEGTLAGGDAPVELDLDVSGVRRLSILCDFGEGMDIADHLNLCNLRAMK